MVNSHHCRINMLEIVFFYLKDIVKKDFLSLEGTTCNLHTFLLRSYQKTTKNHPNLNSHHVLCPKGAFTRARERSCIKLLELWGSTWILVGWEIENTIKFRVLVLASTVPPLALDHADYGLGNIKYILVF